ncbi:SRPBCC domain-containing protein [Agromyces sp. CFH 90414]|uniref:SRPBCC domain-containing protein n=1 Tax=Agromyces agglutinans TaxID=2662258 RepID=A0A6I2FHL5_9MICO|nr:SRPBCC family protein [Agromyces agglutinans]MRG60328.1 SRPBCC domain-containing protein [Agromyces agglutinans]
MTPAVGVSRRIRASAERLFDAWLDPAALTQWMRRPGDDAPVVVADARVGGGFSITMHGPTGHVVHVGEYVEIDRPRALSFTWRSEHTVGVDSIVHVTFTPDDDATVVAVRHELLPDEASAGKHRAGWSEILDRYVDEYGEEAA